MTSPSRARSPSPRVSSKKQRLNKSGRCRSQRGSMIQTICTYLNEEHQITPKKFIQKYLDDTSESLVFRRRQWKSDHGWPSTKKILDSIKRLVYEKNKVSDHWEQWSLEQSIEIVNNQKPPSRGTDDWAPAYVNAKSLQDSFFEDDEVDRRESMLKSRVRYLWTLLSETLKESHSKQLADISEEQPVEPPDTPPLGSSDATIEPRHDCEDKDSNVESNQDIEENKSVMSDESDSEHSSIDLDPAEHAEESRFRRSKDKRVRMHDRINSVVNTIVAIYSFARNRRCNGLQVENSMSLLACGASERINEYLNYIGLTSSRQTALNGLESVGKQAAEKIRVSMSRITAISPFMTIDNIDWQEHKHHTRVDQISKMYHGTWGYVHEISSNLLANIVPDSFTKDKIRQVLHLDSKVNVDVSSFLPEEEEHRRWILTRKGQIAKVLLTMMKPSRSISNSKYCKIPPIDQIKCEVPTIHMLKMMDSADNGSDGVGQLMQEIIHQTGLSDDEYSSRLRIIEGDLGTCLNFNGLMKQRTPNDHADESLENILMIPGAGHTLWNISQAILLHHWGDPSDGNDMGAWQSVVALGGRKEAPVKKKDFTTMLRWIEKIHNATIAYGIRDVLDKSNHPIEESLTLSLEDFEKTVDDTYERYLSGGCILRAHEDQDERRLQLLLRLRDFATIVEAKEAMSEGDIGRLMYMWKQWSVMIQGIKGLTHYSTYLPRLIRLLTTTLPRPIAHVILHSMLVAPSGRPGHFVAKDFFLEIQNYWIKYFYNNSGNGTDTTRLKDTFSINVPFLRKLLHRMKRRSGLNDIYQSSKTMLTTNTLDQYLSFACNNRLNSTTPGSTIRSGPVKDIYSCGVIKLSEDCLNQNLARFHWPLAGLYKTEDSAPDNVECDLELVSWVAGE